MAHSKPLGAAPENAAGKEAASEPTQPVPETHTRQLATFLHAIALLEPAVTPSRNSAKEPADHLEACLPVGRE